MSAVPQPVFNQKRIVIQHHEGGIPSVDSDSMIVFRDQDEVHWICDHPGKKFLVTFKDETPFASATFSEKNYQSGPILKGVRSGEFEYSVEIDDIVNDPKIIVQP
jgi:hypothetical protein